MISCTLLESPRNNKPSLFLFIFLEGGGGGVMPFKSGEDKNASSHMN